MRGYFDAHKKISKPDARELDKRNRQSGLTSALKLYAEDPDIQNLRAGSVWVSLEDWRPRLKGFDGTQIVDSMSLRMSADRGDTDVTLTRGDAPIQQFLTAITTNRTVTLPSDGQKGDYFRVVYNTPSAGSTFTLRTASGTLKSTINKASWDILHDGTQWRVIGSSTL